MKSPKEATLVYVVEDWLIKQGYETRLELQWRPLARTDLVGRSGQEYVAVEVKVRDWRRALEQALCQGKAFDRVYVAALVDSGVRSLRAVLADDSPWTNWVGVLGIRGDNVQVLREARPKPGRTNELHKSIVKLQFLASSRVGQTPFQPKPSVSPAIIQ